MNESRTENWEQAKAVFTEAIERSGADRIAFLNSACGGNASLRDEVESLLRSFDLAGSFMETPAVESAAESLVEEQVHLHNGDRVGHYEVLSSLGEGGMSEVYLARDLVLGRRVALKILPAYLRNDPERLRRFKQEARTASTLNHPNICVIYEVGETEDRHPFITMEYIEGETLRQRLSEGSVSLAEALEIGIQIANALSAAHESGVVHRDIKPDNVMIRRDGYVKVLDFGLAKLTEQRKRTNSTLATLMVKSSPGMVMGTAAYMSPEQARGVAVDARSDIWSLGVVLYEMISGHAPFVGDTPTDTVIAIVEKEQRPISEYIEELPQELERIVRKALRKDADERYQFVKEMAIDLRTLQRELQLDHSLLRESHSTEANANKAISGKSRGVSTKELTAKRRTTISAAEWSRTQLIGAIALLAILIAGSYVSYRALRKPTGDANLQTFFQKIEVTKLTTNGSALYSAISPDGKYVAYIKNEAGKESLWLRQVGSAGNIEIIPAREGHYGGILFGPDGKDIYYGYSNPGNGDSMEVFRVPTLGTGATSVKVKIESGPPSLSHDGKQMAYISFDPVGKADYLKVANVDGTNERVITTRKWPNRLSYDFVNAPGWTSDDKALDLPTANGNANGISYSITEIRLSDSSERVIPLSPLRFEQPYHPTVLPDGNGLVLAARGPGASFSQIWLLSRDGSARTLTNDLSDYHDADLSHDFRSLVTVQTQTLSNIFVSTKFGANERPSQITLGVGRYFDLAWTPDGKILYASDASGNADIYEISLEGTGTRQLTSAVKRNYSPAASPDNRFIVFHSNRGGNFQVWRMDRDGSNPVQLTKSDSESNWPRFSADSKWVYYQHYEPGVPGGLWKIPVEGGTPVRVSESLVTRPVVSPDGKWLGFWQHDDQRDSRWRLAIVSLETEKIVSKFEIAPTVKVQWDTQLRWTADSKSLTYIDSRGGVDNLWAQPIDWSQPKQMTSFADSQIFAFDWAQDGRLVSSRGVITSDVVLISDAGH